jgi:hypothetical protein
MGLKTPLNGSLAVLHYRDEKEAGLATVVLLFVPQTLEPSI